MNDILFGNNNKAVIKKLARRSIAADKRRNLFIVATITLAVCLMSSIAFAYTAQRQQTLDSIRGQYQAGCLDMSLAEIERLAGTGKLEQWGYETGSVQTRYKDGNLNINFVSPGFRDLMGYGEITGNYPESADELCVERAFLEYYKLSSELGSAILLDLGQGEQFYCISGILEQENDTGVFLVWMSEELATLNGGDTPYVLRFRFAGGQTEQPDQLKSDIEAFLVEVGIPEENTFFSSNYFDMTDLYLGSDIQVYGLALLIAIACAIVIYSIFYISVMGKMRQYGRLKVIGATHVQLKGVVKRERRLLLIISIPIGLVLAALVSLLLFPGYWAWADNLKYALIISLLTYAVVLISTRKPLRLVGRVSAIEAVRSTAYYEEQGKTESKLLHSRLTMPRLAMMNFSRDRKKAAITMVSLGLTGIMAICIAAYANSADATEMARASFGDGGDYLLTYDSTTGYGKEFTEAQRDNPLHQSIVEQLGALPGVDHITSYSAISARIAENTKNEDDFLIDGLTKEQMNTLLPEECLLDGTFDYEQLLQGNGIIVVKTADDLIRRLYGMDLKVGDTIHLECHNGISKTYTVMGVISPVQGVVSNFFVLPGEELQSLYPEIQDFTARVNIHAVQDSSQLRQGVYELMDDPRIQIASVEDLEKTFAASMKTQMEQLYGLLAFIFLFALVNLVNTLITSLLARQQELGTLQSVGMSNKQLSRMLSFECLIYVGLTLAVMLTIGTGCSVLLCRQFSQLGLFGIVSYHFPVVQMLVFALALLVIQFVFSVAATQYFGKLSLVDRIRVGD